ncbi:metal ABC transporter permease, partial [Brevibacterium paucivorans]|uniref:metal ABC transporter permease n=1 Tax=Brevibacterium paucivorans TaxID=170994 RepID=UPI0021558758
MWEIDTEENGSAEQLTRLISKLKEVEVPMLVDVIAHSVLPGIVVGYFITRNFDSPLLIIGSALAGLLVVLGAEWLTRTGLFTGDAPQG